MRKLWKVVIHCASRHLLATYCVITIDFSRSTTTKYYGSCKLQILLTAELNILTNDVIFVLAMILKGIPNLFTYLLFFARVTILIAITFVLWIQFLWILKFEKVCILWFEKNTYYKINFYSLYDFLFKCDIVKKQYLKTWIWTVYPRSHFSYHWCL